MMKNNLFKWMLLFFAMVSFVVSCDKSLTQPSVDTGAAQENAATSKASRDIFGAVQSGVSVSKSLTACPIVTFELATGKLKLYYGTGCTNTNDGVNRSGIIYAQVTGYQMGWVDGTKAVIQFDGFKIDGDQITGGMTITAHGSANNLSFTVVATDMVITFSDATKIQWSSTTTMTLMSTDNYGKYWSITGTSTGVSRKNINFSNASTALLTDPRCKWFIGGTLSLTAADNTDLITFSSTCGSVTIKHNSLPAIPFTLN